MSKKHAFVSALLFLGIVSNVGTYGACLYVSPDGDDQTGDGSSGKPWERINTALGKLQTGDTLYLTGGREFNQNVSMGKISVPAERFTITSDPANRARVIGTGTKDGIFVWNRAGVTIENLEIVGRGPAHATKRVSPS